MACAWFPPRIHGPEPTLILAPGVSFWRGAKYPRETGPSARGAGGSPGRVHRTLSEWLNAILQAAFALEEVAEPKADDQTARRVPAVADTRVVAYFLHFRCRKPA